MLNKVDLISLIIVGLIFTLSFLYIIGWGSFWIRNKKPGPKDDIPYIGYGIFYCASAFAYSFVIYSFYSVLCILSLPLWYWLVILIEIGLSIGLVKLVNYRRAQTGREDKNKGE